jgi:hypothetical protein
MRDTLPAAEQARLDAIRRVPPARRLAQALDWSESIRALELSRLRTLHPGRSDLELIELLTGARLLPPRGPHPAT